MSASNAFEFAIPDSDIASGLDNGEKAITVASPIDSVPPRTYWYLSRWFILDGGNYTLKINASDPFEFAIGAGAHTTRRVIAATTSHGFPWQTDFFVRGGRQRIDIQLFNVWLPTVAGAGGAAQPSTCYVAFSLWKNGILVYASAADGWLFDTALLSDQAMGNSTDPRLALPVWTVPPNWENGVLETLSYDTEIFQSEADTEQRRSLARNPRRSVEASFLRAGLQAQRMNEFFVGVGSRKFLVPFWPEQMRIPHSLAIGDNSFVFESHALDGREFIAGGAFILTNGDPSVYEVFTYELLVGTDEAVTMAFYGACTKVWPEGTRITPLYEARFDADNGLESQYVTSRITTATLRFNYVDTDKHTEPSWGYCAPLWRFKIDWSVPFTESFRRNTFSLDTLIAPIDLIDASGVTRVGQSLKITLVGRDKVNAFRAFVAEARGRAVRFWMPTHHSDVTPQGPTISGVSFSGVPNGYSDWLIDPQDSHVMLQFEFNTGAPTIYRKLTGVERSGGSDVYSVDQTIPAIDVDTLSRISFVMPMRFDTDTFELNHVTDDLAVVTAAPTLISAEIYGMPPIECWVTSRPYPIFESDSLMASAIITGGRNPFVSDDMTGTASITGGTMVTYLSSSYNNGEEELTATGRITGGTMVTYVFSTFDSGNDQLTSSAIITSITFPNQLITYTIPAESFNAAAVVTGGTMT